VITEGPVLHVGHGVGAVTFETKHGKGRCRQSLEGDEFCGITTAVLGDEIRFYGLTAGTVAGLTVDERHFRPFDLLLTVDAVLQKFGCLIMIVARFETGLVADIIREKRADQHPFVLSHGNHWTTGLHGRAGNDKPGRSQDKPESGSLTQDLQHQPRHDHFTPFWILDGLTISLE